MSGRIAIFAYDFPHQKSCDFINDLVSYGLKNLVVFAAPKKVLAHLPQSSAIENLSAIINPLNTSELCKNLNLPYYKINHNDINNLKLLALKYHLDLAIIAGARIIKSEVISIFPKGIVNFHPGKIPETSGLDAFAYTLKKGTPAGVTTHFIDKKVDAGHFIRFNQVIVQDNDTLISVQEKIYQLQRKALQNFLFDYNYSRILSRPIERPSKNLPMSQEERAQAFSMFEKWKAKQLYLQSLHAFFNECEAGNIDAVSEGLQFDPSKIFSTNEKGWTPLIVACFNQQTEIVRLLLENGADPNRCGSNGTTPLMYAKTKVLNQINPDLSLLKLLINAGADCTLTDCYGKDLFFYLNQAGDKKLAASIKQYLNQ